jgi:hypothetical protein
LDDFKNRCGQGSHPLLKVIHAELQSDDIPEQPGKLNKSIKKINLFYHD